MLRSLRTVTTIAALTSLLAGLALAGAAAASAATGAGAAGAQATGDRTGAAAAGSGPSGPRWLGVNVHSLWYDNSPADVERQLDLLAGLSANTLRVDVAWSSLQTDGRGTVNAEYRSRVDALVDGAVRRGISPVVVLHTTPCWASSAPESLKQRCTGAYWDRGVTRYPPTDDRDLAWAAGYVAQRWGPRLAALELWNEPNYDVGFTNLTTPDKPARYAAMVRAAYPAVKAVAPDLPVLVGALAFADAEFLSKLYASGITGSYDGISVHPYNESRAPGAAHDPAWAKYDYVLGLTALRAVMTAHGDSRPVWVTEAGWTSCEVGADPWCVTPDQQARYSADLVRITAERFPWVRALILYNLRDKGTDRRYTEDNFGLVTRDYIPKPALASVRAAFAEQAARAAAGTASSAPSGPASGPATGPVSAPVTAPAPAGPAAGPVSTVPKPRKGRRAIGLRAVVSPRSLVPRAPRG